MMELCCSWQQNMIAIDAAGQGEINQKSSSAFALLYLLQFWNSKPKNSLCTRLLFHEKYTSLDWKQALQMNEIPIQILHWKQTKNPTNPAWHSAHSLAIICKKHASETFGHKNGSRVEFKNGGSEPATWYYTQTACLKIQKISNPTK